MSLRRFFLVFSGVVFFIPLLLAAQSTETPDQQMYRFEVFGGFSDYRPGGNIQGAKVTDLNNGWASQFSINCNRWVAVALDVNGHYGNSASAHGVALGPQFKLRWRRLAPFSEILLGVQDFGPKQSPNQNAATYIFGGGVDLRITPRLSIRPIQIDFVNTYYNVLTKPGQGNLFNGFRNLSGLVYAFGLPAPPENIVLASCRDNPASVDAGGPVDIAVTPSGFLPKRTLSYSYTSTGGKLTETTSTASIDTAGLAPGSYTVSVKVADDGKGKHQQIARCQVAFSVNEPPKPHPPVLSVSAEPASLKSGDAATITATSSSPDNRPLNLSCKASDGRLTGSGPAFALDTAGIPDSTVSVTCTVNDDRNLSASASAAIKVNVPPPPPAAKEFGSIEFKHDPRRPTRVDNEAKGELDRYADALASAPDSRGVLVAYATANEHSRKRHTKMTPQVAAQRAVNTKDYLVKEKGIDPARIEVRIGKADRQTVILWIIPPGAAVPTTDTQSINESKVKAIRRIALKTKKVTRGRVRTSQHKP